MNVHPRIADRIAQVRLERAQKYIEARPHMSADVQAHILQEAVGDTCNSIPKPIDPKGI